VLGTSRGENDQNINLTFKHNYDHSIANNFFRLRCFIVHLWCTFQISMHRIVHSEFICMMYMLIYCLLLLRSTLRTNDKLHFTNLNLIYKVLHAK